MMVFDTYGKMVERRFIRNQGETTHFGMDYPAGVYILQLKQGEWTRTVRLVKTNR